MISQLSSANDSQFVAPKVAINGEVLRSERCVEGTYGLSPMLKVLWQDEGSPKSRRHGAVALRRNGERLLPFFLSPLLLATLDIVGFVKRTQVMMIFDWRVRTPHQQRSG